MRKLVYASLFLALLATVSEGQKPPVWAQLAEKDAEKLLNNSPWARTQTETDTSEMFFSPTRPGTSSTGQTGTTSRTTFNDQQSINNNRADRGATNQAVSVNYHVRFFSARPIREAISKIVLLNSIEPGPDLIDRMQTLVDRDFSQYIVITVTFDSPDSRFSGPPLQALASATAGTLRNTTYLERKDGKRLYLMEYRAPQSDGLGAKFVFPRMVNGKSFLTTESGNVRFYSEIGGKIRLNVKYKLSDMIIDGKLEY